VSSAAPYEDLTPADFDATLDFAATGGYALKGYERFAKIKRTRDGLWRVASPMVAQQYRLNVGTIVEDPVLKVRLVRARPRSEQGSSTYTGPLARGGRVLGEIEEYFLETLRPGDTFLFGGEILALQAIVENEALAMRSPGDAPKVPSFMGGKFPLSTHLAARVRQMLASPETWTGLPEPVAEWLRLQRARSTLPPRDALLVETFPRGGRFFMVIYPFEGRLAHQTLGMLLTRRMERAHLRPLGFVANDYALAVWSLADLGTRAANGESSLAALFAPDMLGDDLEEWLRESALMKRMFRNCAIIAGLIERRYPGKEKTGRQITVSTDLIYDVLHRHQPDHVLLRAARADAATGLLDIERLGQMLGRVEGQIVHQNLAKISPLAVPVLLEIGREPVYGEAQDHILAEAAETLVADAMG
jgi:ATP-dependent Lhr-like helicase